MIRSIPDGLRLRGRDRALGAVVAAMSALASLALGGWIAARTLSHEWAVGAERQVTVEVPAVTPSEAGPVVSSIRALPGVAEATIIPDESVRRLIAPWLGTLPDASLVLPVVLNVARTPDASEADLANRIHKIAPTAVLEENMHWGERLTLLGQSLQACAWLAVSLSVVAAIGVTTLSVRMTLAARRVPVEILHGLGASDGHIARRIAWHSGSLGLAGGLAGSLLAWVALTVLGRLAAPFSDRAALDTHIWPDSVADWWSAACGLPRGLSIALGCVPVLAWLIGWSVAECSVRFWLRRLP